MAYHRDPLDKALKKRHIRMKAPQKSRGVKEELHDGRELGH